MYGIWFWLTVGSGIWVHTGRSFRSRSRDWTLHEFHEAKLFERWMQLHNISDARVRIYGYHFVLTSAAANGVVPLRVRRNKEEFPYLAFELGYDTVQLQTNIDNTTELVVTTLGAMRGRAPADACPPVPLAWGWEARCNCTCNSTVSITLNCQHPRDCETPPLAERNRTACGPRLLNTLGRASWQVDAQRNRSACLGVAPTVPKVRF